MTSFRRTYNLDVLPGLVGWESELSREIVWRTMHSGKAMGFKQRIIVQILVLEAETEGRCTETFLEASTTWEQLAQMSSLKERTIRKAARAFNADMPVMLERIDDVFRIRLTERRNVYFLVDEQANAVKIGCSADVHRRVAQLQTGHPRPLVLLGSMPGSFDEEKRIHQLLKAQRIAGEWFALDDYCWETISVEIGRATA